MKAKIVKCDNGNSYILFGNEEREYQLLASPSENGRTNFQLRVDNDPNQTFAENDVSGIKVPGQPDEKEFAIVLRSYGRKVCKMASAEKPGKPYRNGLEHLSECIQAALDNGIAV